MTTEQGNKIKYKYKYKWNDYEKLQSRKGHQLTDYMGGILNGKIWNDREVHNSYQFVVSINHLPYDFDIISKTMIWW